MNSLVTQLRDLRMSEGFSSLSEEAKNEMFKLEHKVLTYEIYLLLQEKGLIENLTLEQLTSFEDFHSLLDSVEINEIAQLYVMSYAMKISDCPSPMMLGDFGDDEADEDLD